MKYKRQVEDLHTVAITMTILENPCIGIGVKCEALSGLTSLQTDRL